MNTKRKYPKVTGWWVYGHITPDGKIYIGYSGRKHCSQRWHPTQYKRKSLEPYIEKFGWNNIKHIVFKDGLTIEQALQLEDLLITQATIDGWCINKRGSGGEWRKNPKKYYKQWWESNKEKQAEKNKKYRDSHKEELQEKSKQYYQEHIIERRKFDKQRNSTPERKIYIRVKTYNYYHPDKMIEAPLEAKQKYLETGYIPNYIKNNDLF